MMNSNVQLRGALYGLGAAVLFGLSAPLAKSLLGEVSPVLLAGLLYLGAAVGLWLHRLVSESSSEASLTLADAPKLSGIVFFGGLVGPVLMLFGLSRVTGLAGSLLLNFEAPLTVLLAVVFFLEHVGRYGAMAVACVVVSAALLKMEAGALGADWLGVVLIVGACLAWAIDNNLTQSLSLKNPFAIVRVKTLAAGIINVLLGVFLVREGFPPVSYVLGALLLGSLSYGASVVLDAFALRHVGAAREAAYFATAPFVGVLVSIVVLGESLRWTDAGAMALMALGVVLLLKERHFHEHTHEVCEHDHLHEHDEHHQHEHAPGDAPSGRHAHLHRHEAVSHSHTHVSDAHHRHNH